MIDRASDRIRFVTRHFRELQGFRYRVPLGLIVLSLGGSVYFDRPELMALRILLLLNGIGMMLFAGRYYEGAFGAVEPLAPTEPAPSLSIYGRGGSAALAQTDALIGRRAAFTIGAAINGYLLLRAFSPSLGFLVDESLLEAPWRTANSGTVFLLGGSQALVTPGTNLAGLAHTLYAVCGAFSLVAWFTRGRRFSQAYHLALGLPLLTLAVAGARLGSLITAGPETFPLYRWVVPAVVHLWIAVLLCGLSLIVTGLLDHLQLVRALGRPENAEGRRIEPVEQTGPCEDLR